MRWTSFSLLLALFLYKGFFILVEHLPQLTPQAAMVGPHPWDNINNLLLNLRVVELLRRSLLSLDGFCVLMVHAFNFCLVPALFGLLLARSATKHGLALLAIGMPALLTAAFFEMGTSFYTQFPRLVYQAYPLVYVLCGLCLARLSDHQFSARWPRIGAWVAILAVLLHFAWVNADVFGHPVIYYFWFYRTGAYA
jgi:drug/metabolite transporter superfamily protein YnfA